MAIKRKKPIQLLKYEGTCRLKRCKQKFQTNRPWQKFCCKDHRIEFWSHAARDYYVITEQIEALRREVNVLKESKGAGFNKGAGDETPGAADG